MKIPSITRWLHPRSPERMPRRGAIGSAGIAVLLLTGSIAAAMPLADADDVETAVSEQAFIAALRQLINDPEGPPAAVAILQRGHSLRIIAVGVSNLETGDAPLPDQHMWIASTSKAYSGAVALALVQSGVLRLDDTVGRWLPDTPKAWGSITLAQLLQHTSGVPNYANTPDFQNRAITAPREPLPPEKLLSYVYGEPLLFEPGTQYRYSNSDNVAVALMAQAATGLSYHRLLELLVFGPLDIHETALPTGFRLPAPSMRGYNIVAGQPPEDVSEALSASFAWASGGMRSTPLDQTRFIRGYIGRKLFGPEMQTAQFDWIAESHSEPPGPGANSAGLGVFRYQTRCGVVFGHTGNYLGYTQFMAATRNGQRSLIVSVNRQLSETVAPRVLAMLRYAEELGVCALFR